MKHFVTDLVPKSSTKFKCELCDYFTCKKSQYTRHLDTYKHKTRTNETIVTDLVPKSSKDIQCLCGISFNNRTTLWRHKKKCNFEKKQDEDNNQEEKSLSDKKLIIMLLKQNTELMDMLKSSNISQANHNTNSLNNNNNKTFNLQFFLNETCKDAMNIMDFVDSIKLQLSDLEKLGELGYTQGISNIITTNLKALDVTQRPVHCTDKKRETMYIKDENTWEKEDDNKTKLRRAIKKVADKNIKLLPVFREKYPEYKNSSSRISDKYDKIVLEAMGGAGNDDIEKEDKIIHSISKCTTIEKYSESNL
jgi:hypothetical protein